jgi:subtilisin family serine protease
VPEPFSWDSQLTHERARVEVAHIARAFGGEGAVNVVAANDGGLDYMHAEGRLLVRDEHQGAVRDILDQDAATVDRVIPGVSVITLRPDTGRLVGQHLELIEQRLGTGVATPDHVLTVAPVVPCPATEPVPADYETEPYPSVCTENSGAGVTVFVADTGLLENAENEFPWLRHVQRAVGTNVERPDGLGPDKKIPPYAGHGTFVAGEVRCMAPQANVIVANVFNKAGSALESDVVQQLDQALGLGVDIFNLSIAAPTRLDLRMLGFDGFLRRLRDHKGAVCVAAAGNDGSPVIQWPAGFPEVVSVGALGSDWRGRARFSNHGSWVDVYAPGRDIVNAFATGQYTCMNYPYEDDIRHFTGMARWSGTSFAAPLMSGMIAARMSRTGENGREAAAALLAEARAQTIPGTGPILVPPGR